jgi:MarR family transcriptional regulator for hemolysin
MDPDIFHRPGHLINRSSRLLMRWGDSRVQPLGFAVAQMPVLYMLKDGNSMTQKDLAARAKIEQPTMAQLLGRMERDGLIRRSVNPEDKRSALVSLTPRAIKKLPQVEGNNEALRGFSEKEIETLCKLLRRVVLNLDPEAEGL